MPRQSIVAVLAAYNSLLEVGIGRRTDVANALAARGRQVIAIDVDDVAIEIDDNAIETANDASDNLGDPTSSGSVRIYNADVQALVRVDDPLSHLGHRGHLDPPDHVGHRRSANSERDESAASKIDAVYACNLPAELQSPTATLARKLDASCLFTTLGFEDPVIPVTRRSLRDETLFIATEDGISTRRQNRSR